MIADVQPIDESVLPRVVQLLSKTNQFNLTTRRHSIEEVRSLLFRPGTFSLCLKLHDRFGDHGLTAVLIAVEDLQQGERALRIETWLMSCRIIARTVENLVFNLVLDHCRRQQIPRIIGEYIPTKKNGLVARLYADLGLEQVPESTPGTIRFSGDVQAVAETTTFVRLNTATATP
jgi:FkbH-like protein